MVDCWRNDPHLRPAASEVMGHVSSLESTKTGSRIQPAPDWDIQKLSQIWKNVKYPSFDAAALGRLQKSLGSSEVVRLTTVRSEEPLEEVMEESGKDDMEDVIILARLKL